MHRVTVRVHFHRGFDRVRTKRKPIGRSDAPRGASEQFRSAFCIAVLRDILVAAPTLVGVLGTS